MAERRVELHHGKLTEVSDLPAHEEEMIDNLLHAVWHAREETGKMEIAAESLTEFTQNRATFLLLAQQEWISISDGLLSLTDLGEQRARQAIRRHRLAERLFFDTFGMAEAQLHESAHRIEHSLNVEVTEKICTFLHHPRTCPHGSPIPRGECCVETASI